MSNLALASVAVSAILITLLSEVRRPRRSDRRALLRHTQALEVLATMATRHQHNTSLAAPPDDAHDITSEPPPANTKAGGATHPPVRSASTGAADRSPFGLAILGPDAHHTSNTQPFVTRWRPVPQPVDPTPLRVARVAERLPSAPPAGDIDEHDDGVHESVTPIPPPTSLPAKPCTSITLATPSTRHDVDVRPPRAECEPGSVPPATVNTVGVAPTPRRRQRTAATIVAAVGAAALMAAVTSTAATVTTPTVTPAVTVPPAPRGGPVASSAQTPTTPLAPEITDGELVIFPVVPPGPVVITATARSWVRVRTPGGEVLAETTLEAGETLATETDGPVEVRLGNPEGVGVRANTTALALPLGESRPVTLVLGVPG